MVEVVPTVIGECRRIRTGRMSRMLEKEWDLAISVSQSLIRSNPLNVYKLSARVIRLAIESEHIESADFAFEVGILIREASTEEVTYLLEHPSKHETNENQQVGEPNHGLLSAYHSFAGHLRDIPNTSTAVPVRVVPSAGPSNKGMLHHYWPVETRLVDRDRTSVGPYSHAVFDWSYKCFLCPGSYQSVKVALQSCGVPVMAFSTRSRSLIVSYGTMVSFEECSTSGNGWSNLDPKS
ncbi:hypothetical protein PCH_Pc17g00040 [Penicillium rubens Wisconsin 54-1255]|uniref:Uncharacterized protein n=1 Tax=Penicillium rubens (strain ATCC 28089 / DSM 1075 / NRRL 1951 / Wisconsin 54-1255) TaxID=500485 RepID=B6HAU1_PENRW|nr:hypothetical protein PCH_Pc17g00040 [Penicillium rubens Wisconsin 54-1255]